jgi:hypothetical protein
MPVITVWAGRRGERLFPAECCVQENHPESEKDQAEEEPSSDSPPKDKRLVGGEDFVAMSPDLNGPFDYGFKSAVEYPSTQGEETDTNKHWFPGYLS